MSATHLDLCSGIGGFALAARWLGIQTIGFCEIDPFCQRVLAKNFPGVPIHDDLTTLDAGTVRQWITTSGADSDANGGRQQPIGCGAENGQQHSERRASWSQLAPSDSARSCVLDIITGGYPCQPFSLAGKRLGAEDDRHLWPYIAALVAELRPRHCLFENVAGHITLGLDRVLADLETLGYTCRPVVVPACAINAPHRRDRVWIMAHANEQRRDGTGPRSARRNESSDSRINDPHANGTRPQGRSERLVRSRERVARKMGTESLRRSRQVESRLGEPDDGFPRWLDGRLARAWDGDWEYGVPRVTSGCTDRVNKLKALGNAIVPQVAYTLMAAMEVAA